MGLTEKILGMSNNRPHIERLDPIAALPGGEVRISGAHLKAEQFVRPDVRFNDVFGYIISSAEDRVIARVPELSSSGPLVVKTSIGNSNPAEFKIAYQVAESIHAVANPTLDAQGNIYTTLSGSRGQKTPVSIFKIDTQHDVKPFLADIMNPTGIAFDRHGTLYVSSRHDGSVYRSSPKGELSVYAQGMGMATGIAFDREGFLYVGDRSGSIFKIREDGETFVFATLEPSVSAYHLAFGPTGDLFVTGPTVSSHDVVHRITPGGVVSEFFAGLGRPQGLAFDMNGNLYVVASLAGRRGIVKITPQGAASMAVSGNNIVGIAFTPDNALVLATNSSILKVEIGIAGMPLWG